MSENGFERSIESRFRFTRAMMQGSVYRKYEKANRKSWNPLDLDYGRDVPDWERLTPEQQTGLAMITARFLAGEQEVTDELLPMLMAADALGRFDWVMYLSTFLLEEAKHSEFFARWHEAVLGIVDPDEFLPYWIDRKATSDPSGRWKVGEPVYEGIPIYGAKLRDAVVGGDEADIKRAFVVFSTLYNVWVEGVLTMPSYELVIDLCDLLGGLETLKQGYRLILSDEGRHITFGTSVCRELIAENRDLEQEVHDAIMLYAGNAVGMLEYQRQFPGLDLEKYQTQKVRHYRNRCREMDITPQQDLIDAILDPTVDLQVAVEAG